MTLLRTDNRGYPVDYLVARVRVRRADLISDWQSLLADTRPLADMPQGRVGGRPVDRSPEGIWRSLLQEFTWVYCQMDDVTKKIFRPFFLYFEIRTLTLCLRNKLAGNSMKVGELLAGSLLASNVKNALIMAEDVSAAVEAVERAFLSLSPAFRGLSETYGEKGLRNLERRLMDRFLEYAADGKSDPVIGDFIRYLIDFRNLMTLYKHSRWELAAAPAFLKGGSIGKTQFTEVFSGREPGGMAELVRGLPGIEGETDKSGSPEHAVLLGITRFLRRRGREPSGIGLILEYLWRSYTETVNVAILGNSRSGGGQAVATELIR